MEEEKQHHSMSSQNSQGSENMAQHIPEIKDIYDSIYGIVQSKLEFYENKKQQRGSRPSTPVRTISFDYGNLENNYRKISKNEDVPVAGSLDSSLKSRGKELFINVDLPSPKVKEPVSPIPVPAVRKTIRETTENPDLLNGCNIQCTKSHTVNLVNDRTEILTEMNLGLKIETENLKHELKKYVERNNELNFEIANIETALEVYYKESKHQKSTISSIYSTIKNYSTYKKEDTERYTYKRIKAISDYVETLKSKLSHQDRIIKDNFLENPYSTDLMMKYDSVKQQLDKLSGDNQDLRNDIKKKQEEEIEIIKELNRQKFKVEEKCRELEVYYKNELSVKDAIIEDIQQQHKSEMEEMQTYLDQKNGEIQKIKQYYEAKDTNSKEELALVYQKWKTMENYNFPK